MRKPLTECYFFRGSSFCQNGLDKVSGIILPSNIDLPSVTHGRDDGIDFNEYRHRHVNRLMLVMWLPASAMRRSASPIGSTATAM
jgi:hypothetical protein